MIIYYSCNAQFPQSKLSSSLMRCEYIFFSFSDKPFKLPILFRQAENYPVDLYYLMDLSNSMEDDKTNLAKLGNLIG